MAPLRTYLLSQSVAPSVFDSMMAVFFYAWLYIALGSLFKITGAFSANATNNATASSGNSTLNYESSTDTEAE